MLIKVLINYNTCGKKITKCKIDLFIFFASQVKIPYEQIFVRTDPLDAPAVCRTY